MSWQRVVPRLALAGVLGSTVTIAATQTAGPVAAQTTPRILSNEAEYRFAEWLTFTLEAEADRPIQEVVLRFTVGNDMPRNRRRPEFTPGRRIVARHRDTLVRGEIPPSSLITWWWTLTTDDGTTYDTAPRSVRYLDERFSWQSTSGPQVRVWWYGKDGAMAQELASRAREVLSRLATLIGSLPDRRIEIVTYQSHEDMRPALVARGEVYEERLATLGARLAPDILLLLAGPANRERQDILAHELSHIVLHLSFDEPYVDAPLWLDEGLAMYAEGPLDQDERELLEQAIDEDRLMSVRSLTSFPGQADLVPLAYAESRDIVDFLMSSHGTSRFQRLLQLVGSGKFTADSALQEAYGYDQEGLYQAYRAARGLPPAATPPPDARRGIRRIRAEERRVPGGVCPSVILALPALLVFYRRRRWKARGPEGGSGGSLPA